MKRVFVLWYSLGNVRLKYIPQGFETDSQSDWVFNSSDVKIYPTGIWNANSLALFGVCSAVKIYPTGIWNFSGVGYGVGAYG